MADIFYSNPTYLSGGAFTIYSGSRRQRGGSVLGSIRKFVVPAGHTLMRGIKSAGQTAVRGIKSAGQYAVKGAKAAAKNETVREVAKKALEHGVTIGTNVAVDALQGRKVGEAIKERAREEALQALTGRQPVTASVVTPSNARLVSHPRPKKRKRSRTQKLKQSTPVTVEKKTRPPAKRRRTLSRARLNRKQLF